MKNVCRFCEKPAYSGANLHIKLHKSIKMSVGDDVLALKMAKTYR